MSLLFYDPNVVRFSREESPLYAIISLRTGNLIESMRRFIMEDTLKYSTSHLYLFKGAEILLHKDDSYRIPQFEEIDLFKTAIIREQPLDETIPDGDRWGELDASFTPPEGYELVGLRTVSQQFKYDTFVRAGLAFQWMDFHRTNQFCGRCGATMQSHAQDRAQECPKCGYLIYPILAPAVIVAVEKGDSLLLARSPHFQPNMMSVVAGFVEPGETLEQTVAREVLEETGIRVKNIRYFGSQPWPFPHSLMLGFTAEWESGKIEIDGVEIEAAGWYTAEMVPPRPPSVSISRMLIDDWIERQQLKKNRA